MQVGAKSLQCLSYQIHRNLRADGGVRPRRLLSLVLTEFGAKRSDLSHLNPKAGSKAMFEANLANIGPCLEHAAPLEARRSESQVVKTGERITYQVGAHPFT